MKNLYLILLAFILTNCNAKQKQQIIDTSWVVDKLVINNHHIPKTNDVILKLKSNTQFSIRLNANRCSGTMELTNKTIRINKAIMCTRMCCDSKFSLAVVEALPMATKYKLTKNSLILYGDNNTTIEFTKQNKTLIKLKNTSSVKKPMGNFIYFEKEPCFRNCPTYTMKIYENGYVYFQGNKLTKKPQTNYFIVSPEKVKPFFTKINNLDFKSYKSVYTDTRIADLSGTIIGYKDKKINLMYGYPDELGKLSDALINFANASGHVTNESEIK